MGPVARQGLIRVGTESRPRGVRLSRSPVLGSSPALVPVTVLRAHGALPGAFRRGPAEDCSPSPSTRLQPWTVGGTSLLRTGITPRPTGIRRIRPVPPVAERGTDRARPAGGTAGRPDASRAAAGPRHGHFDASDRPSGRLSTRQRPLRRHSTGVTPERAGKSRGVRIVPGRLATSFTGGCGYAVSLRESPF